MSTREDLDRFMTDEMRAEVDQFVADSATEDNNVDMDEVVRQNLADHEAALTGKQAELEQPEPEAGLAERMRHRKLGVYRLYWKSGGSSVAAVGMLYDGARWYAPANWTTGSVDADRANVVGTDWSGIERAELIEAYRNTTRRYEPEPEDAP